MTETISQTNRDTAEAYDLNSTTASNTLTISDDQFSMNLLLKRIAEAIEDVARKLNG